MSLTLKVISYKGLPSISPIQAEIGPQGGTIGRKVGNSLVLPDNENIVSGKHAEIVYQNGSYILRDTSTNGTVLVNSGVALNNSETVLQANELLRIGEYEVVASIVADVGLNFDSPFNSPLDIPVAAPPAFPADPFASSSAPLGFDEVKPFFASSNLDLPVDAAPLFADAPAFGTSPTFPEPPVFPGGPSFAAAPAFKEQAPSSPFNDSFSVPDVSPASAPSADISDLLKGLDALSGLSGAAAEPEAPVFAPASAPEVPPFGFAEPVSAPVSAPDFPAPAFAPIETVALTPDQQREADDYLKSLSVADMPFQPVPPVEAPVMTPASTESVFPSPPPHTPNVAFVAPTQNPAAPQVAPAPAVPPQPIVAAAPAPVQPVVQAAPQPVPVAPAAPAISEQQLIKMFLAGAGVSDPHFISAEQWPETMKTVGTLFRSLTEGLMEVLRARAEMKSEFRVSMTTIRTLDNNPLKFNPDVESVLKLMMAPKNPAFIDANDAVKEGFRDIKFHQLAMTAGIQASLAEILYRFNPESFEKILGEGLVFQKKARCWEHYCEKYPEYKNRAIEEFFGDEFAEAYEKQMRLFSQR